jgi:hypothetical protein
MLSEATAQYLSSNCAINQHQLWVYVFFNKRGLLETFGKAGLQLPKARLDDFVMGFNQAAERFLMIDVGNGKEAADAKIKGRPYPRHDLLYPLTISTLVHLDDNIRLPQTLKVLFGGGPFHLPQPQNLFPAHDRLPRQWLCHHTALAHDCRIPS